MFEKFEIEKYDVLAAIVAGLAFFYRKTIGRLFMKTMDEDGDGKVKYLEWVRIPYLFLAGFVVIREGLVESELYSDVKFVVVILASFGVEFLMTYLKKVDLKKRNARPQSNEAEIPIE